MNNILLAIKKPVSEEMPRQFRHALQEVMEGHAPKVISQRISLCLSEAVTNLIEHSTPLPTEVSIKFYRENDGWYLNIFDDGEYWDPTENINDDLITEFSAIENGRGVALLNSQSDDIKYTSQKNEKDININKLQLHWAQPKTQKRQTILIVEDNNSLRLLYKTYLSDKYDILTAENGYGALEELNKHHVDLVLSDIRMPQMNGLTLRKKINNKNGDELIPFIFLTAQDDDMMQEQAADLGIDDYLIKPVNKPQLMKVIQRILGRSKQVYQQLTTRIDKKITDSLKPEIPNTSHGWRMQVASRDTGSGGGDLLLHHQFEGMTQLLLTDIMGHDDSAKFFSHAYGGYLHGLIQSMQSNLCASYLLEQLSKYALNDKILSKVTLTCCSLQLFEAGKINIASAGHPAPLLIKPGGISELDTSGVLLGLIEDAKYKNNDFTIKKGQRIALFTDGLFESAENNEARNHLEKCITDTLSSTLSMPIEKALEEVMSVFDQITKSQPTDDTLLLLLEPIQY